MVKLLLADGRVDLNIADGHSFTALQHAAQEGYAPVVKLLLADKRLDPNGLAAQSLPMSALALAVMRKQAAVVELLLADDRVDPNIGLPVLTLAVHMPDASNLIELLLANERVIRTRPSADRPGDQARYDTALRNVKRPRNARFRGLTRLIVVFRRMRLRAAQAVYAPGGAGFAAAAASFNAAAAGLQQQHQQQSGRSEETMEETKK